MEKKVKIVIATHKKYKMPQDKCYLPLHVGAEGKKNLDGTPLDLGYVKDNTGDNISSKNTSFCELTGLYWAWKNLDADYIGLVHYRRHFCYRKKSSNPFDNILNDREVQELLTKYNVIIPNKRHYYIETLYSHYAHTHYASQLDETRKIMAEQCPEYLNTFDNVVKRTWGYMFNMMIMRRDILNEYCSWLFPILFELERRVNNGMIPDCKDLSFYQGRFYGRVSEVIFNAWLEYQVEIRKIDKNDIREIPIISMEKTNWWVKGTSFLKAKFFGKKYRESF